MRLWDGIKIPLSRFAWATITKYHELGCLNTEIHCLSFGGWKSSSKFWHGVFLVMTLFLSCRWLPSLRISSFSNKCTNPNRLGPTLTTSFNFYDLFTGPISKCRHTGGQGFNI